MFVTYNAFSNRRFEAPRWIANEKVVGSNPIARSTSHRSIPVTWVTVYTGHMGYRTLGPKGLSKGSSLLPSRSKNPKS